MNALTLLQAPPTLTFSKTNSRFFSLFSPNPTRSFRLQRHRDLPSLPPISQLRLSCSSPSLSTMQVSAEEIVPFDDFAEKDWSFLDDDHVNSPAEIEEKTARIIAAGAIEESSKVVVCLGSEEFVDRLRDSHKCPLLVVHYSLYVLAVVKEKYDTVRCWQGDVVDLPERWAPFDAIFLNYFPALPCSLDRLLDALVSRCSPGARIIINYAQGREIVERQRQRYPDMVTSELPDKETLEKIATDHSFQIIGFVDEPTFYLATLKYKE